jgi:hypothetical protein
VGGVRHHAVPAHSPFACAARVAQYKASQFRLYVHEAAAAPGGRGGGGANVVITEYSGKLSRFARTGKPSTSSQTNSGRAAVLSSDGGEDVEARKAELKQQLTAAEAAADDAKRAHTAKADERNAVQSEKRRLAKLKLDFQKFLATPKQLADVIGSLKRAREAKKRDLDKFGENARAGKRKEFEKKLDEYLKRFDAAMALARRVLALQVETAAASHATKGLEAAIEDAAKAVSDAREGLKEFKVADKDKAPRCLSLPHLSLSLTSLPHLSFSLTSARWRRRRPRRSATRSSARRTRPRARSRP